MNRTETLWALVVLAVALFIGAFISIDLAPLVLIFGVAAWWTWLYPKLGLVLFIVIAPLLPLLKFTQSGGALTLVKDVMILTLFGRTVVYPLLTKSLPYRRNPLFMPLAALAVWVIVGTLQSDILTLGVLRARDIALYAILYFAVLHLPISRAYLRSLVTWSLVVAFILMGLGAYQLLAAVDSAVLRFDPAREIWIPRVSSTLGHPSVFGEVLILVTAVAFGIFIATDNRRWRIVALLIGLLSLPLLYLTYSRGAWLGMGAALCAGVATLLFARRTNTNSVITLPRVAAAIVTVVLLAAIVLLATPAGTFLASGFDPTYASNAIRLDFMARLIAPLTPLQAIIGAGLGDVVIQNFRDVTVGLADITTGAARTVQVAKDATLVDNQYLKTFVELGLIGSLIYLWIYWQVLVGAWSLSKSKKVTVRATGLIMVAFLAAFVVQGLFIDIWDIFPTNAYFWILAGVGFALQTPALYKKV